MRSTFWLVQVMEELLGQNTKIYSVTGKGTAWKILIKQSVDLNWWCVPSKTVYYYDFIAVLLYILVCLIWFVIKLKPHYKFRGKNNCLQNTKITHTSDVSHFLRFLHFKNYTHHMCLMPTICSFCLLNNSVSYMQHVLPSFHPLLILLALLEMRGWGRTVPSTVQKKSHWVIWSSSFSVSSLTLHFQKMNLIMTKSQTHPLWWLSNCQHKNDCCGWPPLLRHSSSIYWPNWEKLLLLGAVEAE